MKNQKENPKESGLDRKNYETRWSDYREALNRVIDGKDPLLMTYGIGGFGQTYEVEDAIRAHKLTLFEHEEGAMAPGSAVYDAVILNGNVILFGGSIVAWALKELHQHKGKLLVFDDAERLVRHPEFSKIVKAISARDHMRVIECGETDGLPTSFLFTGRVIVITKMEAKEFPKKLGDNSFAIDLTMTVKETLEKLYLIYKTMDILDADGIPMDISQESRDEAFALMKIYEWRLTPSRILHSIFGNLARHYHWYSSISIEQLKEEFKVSTEEEVRSGVKLLALNYIQG